MLEVTYPDSTLQGAIDDVADVILVWFPQFRAELYGLEVTGPMGRVLRVSEDGDELLVGLYANAEADEQIDGLIVPADATLAELRSTLTEWIARANGHAHDAASPAILASGLRVGQRIIYRGVIAVPDSSPARFHYEPHPRPATIVAFCGDSAHLMFDDPSLGAYAHIHYSALTNGSN